MAPFVHLVIILGGIVAVLTGRDDRGNAALDQSVPQPVGIKGAVGQQVIGAEFLNQFRHAAQVVGLSGQKAEIDEIAKRVRQRQNFGRDATARTPYGLALSPPFAPCPER